MSQVPIELSPPPPPPPHARMGGGGRDCSIDPIYFLKNFDRANVQIEFSFLVTFEYFKETFVGSMNARKKNCFLKKLLLKN